MRSAKISRARRAGYTLIELMIVVTIIGVSAVAFTPGLGRAAADRRVSSAARELIRIGRRARADTSGYLRAHMIWIDPAAGRMQLLRGTTNSCTLALTPWETLQADCEKTPVGPGCLENLSISTLTNDTKTLLYEETLSSGNNVAYATTKRALCYAPNGVVYWGTASTLALTVAAGLSEANSVNGGFVYTLHTGPGVPTSTSRIHRVLFPLGGTARSLR